MVAVYPKCGLDRAKKRLADGSGEMEQEFLAQLLSRYVVDKFRIYVFVLKLKQGNGQRHFRGGGGEAVYERLIIFLQAKLQGEISKYKTRNFKASSPEIPRNFSLHGWRKN